MNPNQEYFEYLDSLRESGAANMLEAPEYLAAEFDLTKREAENVFWAWVDYLDGGPA